MTKKKLTYKSALEEIEAIVHEIEHGDPEIDQLSAKISRALELVTFCKDSIRKTDDEISKALQNLED